ncbi:uncharacterized protein LOC119642964 [Glossina fuscipes]|uniref:Uncharacterized protein LOC119642964 n=1 Tax=Glossina fuscipes TaxID=7396 RepID=A0A9C5ZEQ6_9MUSC|nr:uncharacterized protein LOC119642964 [Glossina fuscipes]
MLLIPDDWLELGDFYKIFRIPGTAYQKITRQLSRICLHSSICLLTAALALVEADVRIHFLLLFLKIWAKHMQIVKYGNMSSYCLMILAIFYLQQPLENYNNLAILLPIKKLQANCNEHFGQSVNYAFDVQSNENKPCLAPSITTELTELMKGFFGFYKSCDLSSVLSSYLGSAIPRNDYANDSINFFEYHNQLLTMSQYFDKDPEWLRIDTCLCVHDPFCLHQNEANSLNGTKTEYFEYCLANVFSIFSICQNNDNMVELYEKLIFDLHDPFEILPMKVNETKHVEPTENLNGTSEKPPLYRLELDENSTQQEENRSLSKDSSKCEDIKSWFISGSTDLWTSRYHQKTHDRTFMEYRMDQTERLYNAQNPLYSLH